MLFQDVLQFWFEEIEPRQWWRKDAAFDALVQQRFGDVHVKAVAGDLAAWRTSAEGSLAEVIVLDQFSRNIYRDTPQAFASDELALEVAQQAVAKQFDEQLNNQQRQFLYMPYMHSESALVHRQAVILFSSLAGDNSTDFELRHKAIIDRFGRYPHRNAILGRTSTAEELDFLAQPGSSF